MKAMQPIAHVFALASSVVILACSPRTSSEIISSKRMADGKEWLTENLKVKVDTMYCYQDDEKFCAQYGGLYTWHTAKKVCASLGDGWRLPTDDEWKAMAKFYGGVYDDSNDSGKSAYVHLIAGGDSGFNALLAGNREPDGGYQRLEAHGFYWTSSEYDSAEAWFYNFGKRAPLLNHHTGGKKRALSVRCIRD